MEMEIKIISTEIIKPSSPTPHHLKTHKLFFSNQLAPDAYFPMILFYSAESNNEINISSHLKNSLSKSLTYYYPFAGQIIDGVSVDCNDHGAVFIETRIANQMSKVVQKPDNDLLKQLLPFSGDLQQIPNTYQANLVVQVNYFTCGGMAISVCFRHLISDGVAAANFLKSWGEVARDADDIKNVVVDFTSIFRQYESIAVVKSVYEHQHVPFPSDQRVVKRFVFDGKKIAALRQKVGNGPHLNRPTRFETISALLLRAFMAINAAGKGDDEFTTSQLAAVIPINLRNKTNPPLPQQCLGNLAQPTIAYIPMDQNTDYNIIAGKLRESINKVVEQYKKNMHEVESAIEGCPKSRVFSISDWTRFPCYETDFGWGKPIWVATVALMDTGTALLASSDGAGDEAWVALPREEMAKFEQHPEILAHTNPLFMSKYSRL